MHFVKFLGSQNCLPDEKIVVKEVLPNKNLALRKASVGRNWALKYHYSAGIDLSNIITGRESQFFVQ